MEKDQGRKTKKADRPAALDVSVCETLLAADRFLRPAGSVGLRLKSRFFSGHPGFGGRGDGDEYQGNRPGGCPLRRCGRGADLRQRGQDPNILSDSAEGDQRNTGGHL